MSCSLHDTKLQAVTQLSLTRCCRPGFPCAKRIMDTERCARVSCSYADSKQRELLSADHERLSSWQNDLPREMQEVPLTCAFKVAQMKLPETFHRNKSVIGKERNSPNGLSKPTCLSLSFSWGKGHSNQERLGGKLVSFFSLAHYRSCLVLSQWRDTTVNCQEKNLFTAVLPLPHVNFREQIQGEDDFASPEKGKRVQPRPPPRVWGQQCVSVHIQRFADNFSCKLEKTQSFPIILIPTCFHPQDRKERSQGQ